MPHKVSKNIVISILVITILKQDKKM